MATTLNSPKIMEHIFKDLGQAPYRLIGYVYDPPVQGYSGSWSGGSHCCDHCGQPISHVFMCRSSDGKEFNLGSVHVEKLGDEGLVDAVKAKMREVKREARYAKQQAEWEAARPEREKLEQERQAKEAEHAMERDTHNLAEFERVSEKLKALPHPNAFFARRGKTKYDYMMFFWDDRSYSECDTALMVRRNWKVMRILIEAGADIES